MLYISCHDQLMDLKLPLVTEMQYQNKTETECSTLSYLIDWKLKQLLQKTLKLIGKTIFQVKER